MSDVTAPVIEPPAEVVDLSQSSGADAPPPAASVREPASHRRDAGAAKAAAAARLETARKVQEAVESYHDAADRIDAAQAALSKASEDRLRAIGAMRTCRLTISEICDLTGLSSSRIQALAKESQLLS